MVEGMELKRRLDRQDRMLAFLIANTNTYMMGHTDEQILGSFEPSPEKIKEVDPSSDFLDRKDVKDKQEKDEFSFEQNTENINKLLDACGKDLLADLTEEEEEDLIENGC